MVFLKSFVVIVYFIRLVVYAEIGFRTDTQETTHLIEEGKGQYELLNARAKHPHYGVCWQNAVLHLHEGCNTLTEHIQSDIALKFTDCFLRMSGHESYECEDKIKLSRNECLQGMSDRAFNVYTEFYTHTQSICFFLRGQMWHEATEKNIDRLSYTSKRVTKQLEDAGEMQNAIFKHQKESLMVQLELLENGRSLRQVLHESQNSLNGIMDEFRSSTLEQRKLLFDVFEHISSLQEWAVGEISWLDTIVFYLSSAVIAYIITATPRTQGARLSILLAFTFNAIVERMLCAYFIKDIGEQLHMLNEHLYWWTWFCRKIVIIICALIFFITAYCYCDYNIINYELLVHIKKQNTKLINYMEKMKIFNFPANINTRNEISSQTDDYNPDASICLIKNEKNMSTKLQSASEDDVSSTYNFHLVGKSTPTHFSKTERYTSTLNCSQVIPFSERLYVVDRSSSPSPSIASRTSSSSRRKKPLLQTNNPNERYSLRSHHSSGSSFQQAV